MKTISDKNLIVITGPTGSGKTELAVEVATILGCPILSADSRQFYREIPIGTAQPTHLQLSAARHYFIADRSVTEPLSAGKYAEEASQLMNHLWTGHENVILCGGSGLYIDALCDGFDDIPDTDPAVREALNLEFSNNGLEVLLEELKLTDPDYYRLVDRDNYRRVIRALEVIRSTGRPFSSFRTGQKIKKDYRILKFAPDLPRDVLYERIDRRVGEMIGVGLEQEARSVEKYRELPSLRTVGYSEFFDYFDGRISFDEAVELIKRNSRRYAKRQLTWLRRDPAINSVDISSGMTSAQAARSVVNSLK